MVNTVAKCNDKIKEHSEKARQFEQEYNKYLSINDKKAAEKFRNKTNASKKNVEKWKLNLAEAVEIEEAIDVIRETKSNASSHYSNYSSATKGDVANMADVEEDVDQYEDQYEDVEEDQDQEDQYEDVEEEEIMEQILNPSVKRVQNPNKGREERNTLLGKITTMELAAGFAPNEDLDTMSMDELRDYAKTLRTCVMRKSGNALDMITTLYTGLVIHGSAFANNFKDYVGVEVNVKTLSESLANPDNNDQLKEAISEILQDDPALKEYLQTVSKGLPKLLMVTGMSLFGSLSVIQKKNL